MRVLTLLLVALTLAAQQTPRPEPPKDAWCAARPGTPKNKLCQCHRRCADGGNGDTIIEDAACLMYSAPSQCRCGVSDCS